MLFDEPTTNVEVHAKLHLIRAIKTVIQRTRQTIVYVTHDQTEAMTLGDRVAVLRGGLLQQLGSPAELYANPRNLFVAGFIGSPAMNFLPGTLRRAGGTTQVELDDGTRIAAPARAVGTDGQPVILGTRPEHLTLASTGIPSTVIVVEPTGADTFVSCRHGASHLAAVFRERHDFAPDSTIHLQPDSDRAHLFDGASGKRLAA